MLDPFLPFTPDLVGEHWKMNHEKVNHKVGHSKGNARVMDR